MTGMIDINNLSKYEENNRIEVKRAKGGFPNSIWETYSAFANTDGGIILLGVDEKEDHTLVVTGLEDVHKMKTDFWNIINNKQKVSLNILTERMASSHTIEGKDILCIEVPKADRRHRPIYVGNDPMRGTYRRGFEGDYLCAKEEVAAMYRDSSDTSIDQKVLLTFDISAFDMDTVHRYRNRFARFHPTHIWIDDDDELFLRHIGAIALSEEDIKFHPTCAGLLMFGYEYDIVREYPHYFLDYQEKESDDIRWTHRFTSSSGDWSGNLYDFFFRVYPRITSDLPVPFVTKGMDRQDDTPLHLALREVLLNSIAHADFYSRQGIVIVKGRDRITFANPGDIRIGLQTALAGGVSDPRNETVMKMFSLIDVGERAGSGIPDFMSTWQKHFRTSPVYTITHNPERTLLTISVAGSGLIVPHEEHRSGLGNETTGRNSVELSKNSARISEIMNGDGILLINNMLYNQYSSTELLGILNLVRTQQELSKRSSRSFVSTTLKLLIEAGLLAPLYPKTPHHPKQRYSLTQLGVEVRRGTGVIATSASDSLEEND
ncbi:MAG: RNA-binding domain-containing protein [Parabacteroides sp.]